MKKFMYKGFMVLISILLITSSYVNVFADSNIVINQVIDGNVVFEGEVDEIQLALHSNVCTTKNAITLYERKYYDEYEILIDMNDVKALTRCAYRSQSNSSGLTNRINITQGIRKIEIDIAQQTLSEFGESSPITAFRSNKYGKLLVPAIPMLQYLGADCCIDGNTFYAFMPPNLTFWEALNFNAQTIQWTEEDWYNAYGGKTAGDITLVLSLIMDVMNPFSKQKLFASAEYNDNMYVQEALYDIYETDMYSYQSVKDEEKEESEELTAYLLNVLDFESGIADELIGNAEEATERYLGTLKNEIPALRKVRGHYLGKKEYTKLSPISKKISNKCVEKINVEESLDNFKVAGNILTIVDVASLVGNIHSSANTLTKYSYDNINMLNSVFGSGTKKHLNIDNNDSYSSVAMYLYKSLSSKENIYYNSIIENSSDFIYNAGVEMITKSNSLWTPFELGAMVASLILHEDMEGYHADVIGSYLVGLQNYSAFVYAKAFEKAKKENFKNQQTLEIMRDSLIFFCRSGIAINENFKKICSGKNREENIKRLDKMNEYTAWRLYLLTVCNVSPYKSYSEFDSASKTEDLSQDDKQPTQAEIVNKKDTQVRDIVLVLDESGSMDGEPLEKAQDSAIKFIYSIVGGNTRVGLVSYATNAKVVAPFTQDINVLYDGVLQTEAWGQTNISDALDKADRMLQNSTAQKKIIVLLSDGAPNEGLMYDELTEYADNLKNKGYYIYTLGFYHNLYEYERMECESVLKGIASENSYFIVDNIDDLIFLFNDVSEQITGQTYILVRIACPVDVTVSFDGETLSSSEDSLNKRTSFGTLSFEGVESEVKILRLKTQNDYDIVINGTGEGEMTYSIKYPNEDGEYIDSRIFQDIPITSSTLINTSTEYDESTVLDVDKNGDGRSDIKYKALSNDVGEVVEDYTPIYFILGGICILGLVLFLRNRKSKKFN